MVLLASASDERVSARNMRGALGRSNRAAHDDENRTSSRANEARGELQQEFDFLASRALQYILTRKAEQLEIPRPVASADNGVHVFGPGIAVLPHGKGFVRAA